MSAINSNPNNYNKVSKEVWDWYSNFVNGNNEVNDIGLRNYEYIKERIFHNSDSNPYDFLSDKSILNKLKRELFGKQNNLVIDTDNIIAHKAISVSCKEIYLAKINHIMYIAK